MRHINLILIIILLSTLSFATNYHVAVNGSDLNSGTITSPFRTLQKAADQVNPGDTVYVHGGVYTNSDFDINKTTPDDNYANSPNIWGGNDLLRIVNVNGSVDAYIIFQPYQNDTVVLKFDNNYGVLIKNSSYIKFKGFIIRGIADKINQSEANAAWGKYKKNDTIYDLATILNLDLNNPPEIGSDIPKEKQLNSKKPSYYNGRGLVVNSSHDVEVSNNIFEYVPSSAIRVQQSDRTTVTNNEVRYCTYWTTAGVGAITVAESISIDSVDDVKIKLVNNYVHHNENRMVSWNPTKTFIHWVIDEGTGLFLTRNNTNGGNTTGSTNYEYGKILIANNVSAFNGASGIVCHYTNDVIIEHNTCYKNGTTNNGTPGGIGVNTSNDVKIINNISYARPNKWALGKLAGTLNNITISNNLLYNENGTESIHNQMPDGWFEADPLFVDAANNNFHLSVNSPAVNAGTINAGQMEDIDGNLRDSIPDIGAYEYIGSSNILVDSIIVQGEGDVSAISTAGGTLQMEATVLPANATNPIYSWSVINLTGDATIDINGLLTAVADGEVIVRATANDDSGVYGETIITISNQTLKIAEYEDVNIKVYPNPCKNYLVVEYKNIENVNNLKVYNVLGENSSNKMSFQTNGNKKIILDLTKLAKGAYIVKLNTYTKVFYKE